MSLGEVAASIQTGIDHLDAAPSAKSVEEWNRLQLEAVKEHYGKLVAALGSIVRTVVEEAGAPAMQSQAAAESAQEKFSSVTEGTRNPDAIEMLGQTERMRAAAEIATTAASAARGHARDALGFLSGMGGHIHELEFAVQAGREHATESYEAQQQAIAAAEAYRDSL